MIAKLVNTPKEQTTSMKSGSQFSQQGVTIDQNPSPLYDRVKQSKKGSTYSKNQSTDFVKSRISNVKEVLLDDSPMKSGGIVHHTTKSLYSETFADKFKANQLISDKSQELSSPKLYPKKVLSCTILLASS